MALARDHISSLWTSFLALSSSSTHQDPIKRFLRDLRWCQNQWILQALCVLRAHDWSMPAWLGDDLRRMCAGYNSTL
eukprot:2234047-Amphidinium_carterae.1